MVGEPQTLRPSYGSLDVDALGPSLRVLGVFAQKLARCTIRTLRKVVGLLSVPFRVGGMYAALHGRQTPPCA